MVDLPADGEGLSWIASNDLTQLLLIPGLQLSSVVAAADGDQQALAYVRFTAQHFAAYAGTRFLNPLDEACLAASNISECEAYSNFINALRNEDPQLSRVFETRQSNTRKLLDVAASKGEVSAMKWIRAICPRTLASESGNLMAFAAENGQLEVLKYLRSGPDPEDWDPYMTQQAARHLDCIKWLLSSDVPGGPCPCTEVVMSRIAQHHGLPALQWFRANQELPAELWHGGLLATAAAMGDQPMLEWLRALAPPLPWSEQVTAAATKTDLRVLQWLRAQDPPCPLGRRTCRAAARHGRLDILVWLRGQDPPCPWDEQCTAIAAGLANPQVLQWLHSAGCPLGSGCLRNAARSGNLQALSWLCDQGCQLTGDLYLEAARRGHIHILRFLHRLQVPGTTADPPTVNWCRIHAPTLMFLADIGMQLPPSGQDPVKQARKACCTFQGLIRWCRRAISDPSKGGHRAFDCRAEDSSGQLLLTRLCQLPPELVSKITVAAELQHDISDTSE